MASCARPWQRRQCLPVILIISSTVQYSLTPMRCVHPRDMSWLTRCKVINFLGSSDNKALLHSFECESAEVAGEMMKHTISLMSTSRAEKKKSKASHGANKEQLHALLDKFSPSASPEPPRRSFMSPRRKKPSSKQDSLASFAGMLSNTSSSTGSTASYMLPTKPNENSVSLVRANINQLDPAMLELLLAAVSNNAATVVRSADSVCEIVEKICEVVPKTLHEGVPLLSANLMAAADCLVHIPEEQAQSRLNAIEHIGLMARQVRDATKDLAGIYLQSSDSGSHNPCLPVSYIQVQQESLGRPTSTISCDQ